MSDEERTRERAAILKRRAQLVAYAVATGILTASCSGKTSAASADAAAGEGGVSGEGGSHTGGSLGGTPSVCLTPPK